MKRQAHRSLAERSIIFVTLYAILLLMLCAVTWLFSPAQGSYTFEDGNLASQCRTYKQVVATFGEPVPDDMSVFSPRRPGFSFWKEWKGSVANLHIEFDDNERVVHVVVHRTKLVNLFVLIDSLRGR